MPDYLRHKNGNGKIFDSDVSSNSFVSRDSVVRGASDVGSALVYGSTIESSCVFGAFVENSQISATTVAGQVHVVDSFLCCDLVAGTVSIQNSMIMGESKIKDQAIVKNSRLRNWFVFGQAKIENVIALDGSFGRIRRGVWRRAPRVHRFSDLAVTVTESVRGFAFVGCQEKPVDFWLSSGAARLGKANGWTPNQICELQDLLSDWQKTQTDFETPFAE